MLRAGLGSSSPNLSSLFWYQLLTVLFQIKMAEWLSRYPVLGIMPFILQRVIVLCPQDELLLNARAFRVFSVA